MAVAGKEKITAYAAKKREIRSQLKQMVVDQLCLDLNPEFITNDQPLFGRDDDKSVLSSINSLADYVMKNQEDGAEAQTGTAELSGGMDLG